MSSQVVPRRVVKLGGSLLSLADIVPRLRQWLAQAGPAETLMVVGGGALVDAIRAAHRSRPIPGVDAHWQCIRAMQAQTGLLVRQLPEAELIANVGQLIGQAPVARLGMIDPWSFVAEEEPRLSTVALPELWDVTSDSIAARLAELVGAAELILLKSAPAPEVSREELSAAGYVDRFFPQAAAKLPCVRFVNLRDATFAEVVGNSPSPSGRGPG